MNPKVAVIRTGLANLASVLAGLRRAGADPYVTERAEDVASERIAMLPGVGAFGAGMEILRNSGIDEALRSRFEKNCPTVAICLGLQLLCRSSEETAGVEGLGFVDGVITRFPNSVIVPQLGWNQIEPQPGCRFLDAGYTYFANSFSLQTIPTGWQVATAEHGVRFVAAMERGSWLACQFHPELSGHVGSTLLRRWIEAHSAPELATC